MMSSRNGFLSLHKRTTLSESSSICCKVEARMLETEEDAASNISCRMDQICFVRRHFLCIAPLNQLINHQSLQETKLDTLRLGTNEHLIFVHLCRREHVLSCAGFRKYATFSSNVYCIYCAFQKHSEYGATPTIHDHK
jgi:hypothetical protein